MTIEDYTLNRFENNIDQYAAELFADNINLMVPWYLIAAYAYYKEDNPIFSDYFFDNMARTMLECWDEIEHRHKELISESDLRAGSYLGEYPGIVIGALNDIRKRHRLF